jgi:flagellin
MEFTTDTTAEAYIFSVTTADGLYQGAINTEAVDVDTAGVATLNRTTTLTLTSGVGPGSITIKLDGTSGTPFDPAASIAADTTGDFAGSTQLSLSFKLGSGTEAEDSLSFSLDGVSASALGLDSHEIVSAGQAGDAVTQINTALDNLNGYRAKVGASQNRLDFAASNLRVSIENAEAARSNLLDLDIAQEMTNFTSKQVLLQSGVAMLAQANQMPQNLLRLLQ